MKFDGFKNFKLSVPTKKSESRVKTGAKAKAISERGCLADVKFMRDSSGLSTDDPPPDDNTLLAKAWTVSPERTICALAECGYSPKEIAGKIGYKSTDVDFQRILRTAQNWLKNQIAGEAIGVIPVNLTAEYIDSDGSRETATIGKKLRESVRNALFSKSMTATVNFARGLSQEIALTDLFGASVDEILKTKAGFKREYAKTFRTREPGEHRIGSALPPALAKFGIVAAPAAEPTAQPKVE